MKQSILKIATGATGIGATEVVEVVQQINPETVTETVGLIGQLVIILATIWSLFKRKKNNS